MKLILIRHGMTVANEEHRYQGSLNGTLSEEGIRQLKNIREEKVYPDISQYRLLNSGMVRCIQTSEVLFGEQETEEWPEFQEMNFGVFEGYTFHELKNQPDYRAWIQGDNEANIAPEGESGNQMKARVLESLDRLIRDGRDTVLITHGGPIAAMMESLFPEEGRNRYEWQPEPGEGYLIELGENRKYSKIKI